MAPVDREKEIAIGTVTVFLVWFVNGTGGGEPIIVKLVKHYKTLFQIIQQKYILVRIHIVYSLSVQRCVTD